MVTSFKEIQSSRCVWSTGLPVPEFLFTGIAKGSEFFKCWEGVCASPHCYELIQEGFAWAVVQRCHQSGREMKQVGHICSQKTERGAYWRPACLLTFTWTKVQPVEYIYPDLGLYCPAQLTNSRASPEDTPKDLSPGWVLSLSKWRLVLLITGHVHIKNKSPVWHMLVVSLKGPDSLGSSTSNSRCSSVEKRP